MDILVYFILKFVKLGWMAGNNVCLDPEIHSNKGFRIRCAIILSIGSQNTYYLNKLWGNCIYVEIQLVFNSNTILISEPFDTSIVSTFMQMLQIYCIMQQWFPRIVGPSSPFTWTIHPYNCNQVNQMVSAGLKAEINKMYL